MAMPLDGVWKVGPPPAKEFTLMEAEESPYKDSLEFVLEYVRQRGFFIIQSTPTTLLLDIDKPFINSDYRYEDTRAVGVVSQISPIVDRASWASKSGNTHVVLLIKNPLPILVRLSLQAALGSDPIREILGVKRALAGMEEPSFLFRPPTNIVRPQHSFRELDL